MIFGNLLIESRENSTPCSSGHYWIYSGLVPGEIPEGTLCACGMVKYEKPHYCDKCGQQLIKR